jgi:hypothetical protein
MAFFLAGRRLLVNSCIVKLYYQVAYKALHRPRITFVAGKMSGCIGLSGIAALNPDSLIELVLIESMSNVEAGQCKPGAAWFASGTHFPRFRLPGSELFLVTGKFH